MGKSKLWSFWIDCGGTFTDIMAASEQGEIKFHKLLSSSPLYESPVIEGISQMMGRNFSTDQIKEVRLGTTVATNAFLERKGLACGLVTTLGFRDVLEIRGQNRPKLFELDIEKIKPLYAEVVQVDERILSDGTISIPMSDVILEFELQRLLDKGIKSVAISFMHSVINPIHEKRAAELAKKMGFDYISLSHEVAAKSLYIARTETCVTDAYLTPLLAIYTEKIQKALGACPILYMQSSGGLCAGDELKGHNALLSGPAGGLVGACEVARKRNINKIIAFDMGGTSTDVAIFDGKESSLNEFSDFHGLKMLAPMLDIHTVAAGGGSILKYDGQRFLVGPESAGAYPGPACYGNGGPLTITDANLFLQRIDPEIFPQIFGPQGNAPLDSDIVDKKFQELSSQVGIAADKVAMGFLEVAAATMARAIKKVSVEKGHDPKDFTLVSFGGAAGQIICLVADQLGITKIFIHPLASGLSAYGIGMAKRSIQAEQRIYQAATELPETEVKKIQLELQAQLHAKLALPWKYQTTFNMRQIGSDHNIAIDANTLAQALEKFNLKYLQLFGIEQKSKIEILSLKVLGSLVTENNEEIFQDEQEEFVTGPMVFAGNKTIIVVESGWSAQKNKFSEWMIERETEVKKQENTDIRAELEIYYQKFQSIAEQMGYALKNLAMSVNIKERNDFSCAIFTEKGELLANAPHIPVHLGSMGDAVKSVINIFNDQILEGDAFICNDPNFGGTHLPDLTIITPVFFQNKIIFWVASRGHHGDIGGIAPGSMPGSSTKLSEEGVIIPPTKIVSNGKFQEQLLFNLLMESEYPARNPKVNIHDIQAKIAANEMGKKEIIHWSEKVTPLKLQQMAENVLDYTFNKIKETLKDFATNSGELIINEKRKLKVVIKRNKDKLVLDFTGTSDCGDHNFNTPLPVVKASILFTLRSLIEENLPLNDGIARFLEIVVPKNSLLNPSKEVAVVAGNVETSQIICDLLFEVFKVKANSQGTMNNLSFGNENYQYYETIGGGSGATANACGASAVQVNMTNSVLTDPEVLELRYPVILELMAIRLGSGGHGRKQGGDGVYRRIKFLQDFEVSMLSQRRQSGPQGLAGGYPGMPGYNRVEYANGEMKLMPENFTLALQAGDRICVETPGGGGHGEEVVQNGQLVFAYGSNMDQYQIHKRCPGAKIVGRAQLSDFELRYTLYSDVRAGGVADTFHAPGEKMWGIVYRLNDSDLNNLDEIECGKGHYKRVERKVLMDDNTCKQVWCYDVNDKNPDICPTAIYEWLVYSGAYMLNAPNSYLQHIRKFSTPPESL